MSVTLLTQALLALRAQTHRSSKRRYPVHGEAMSDTGPEAASKIAWRRNLHRGHGSTLRKLQRIKRIEAGLRPQRFAN